MYSDVDCTKLISGSPFTTDGSGIITIKLAPGTYYVKEVDESSENPLWDYDTTTRKVVVKAGETGSVTFNNTHYGYGQIVKKTNTGGTLDGWKFNVYTDEACTKLVSGSPFTTNAQGLITTRLLPGTYWVKEVDESSKRPDWEFDTATRKLTVTAGNTSSVTFNNKHFGYAQIVKETSTGIRPTSELWLTEDMQYVIVYCVSAVSVDSLGFKRMIEHRIIVKTIARSISLHSSMFA